MDQHQMIHFTTAQLRGSHAMTTSSLPSRTSYNQRRARASPTPSSSVGSKRPREIDLTISDRTEAIDSLGNQVRTQNVINLMDGVDVLHREIFNLEREVLELGDTNPAMTALLQCRISQLESTIAAKAELIEPMQKKANEYFDVNQ